MNRNQAFSMLKEANPVPDVHEYAQLTGEEQRPEASAFLTNIDQERDDVTQLIERDQEQQKADQQASKRPWWQPAIAAAVLVFAVIGVAVFAGSLSGGDDVALTEVGVAQSVDEFVAAWNRGDEAAVTAWLEGVTLCERGPTCRQGAELVDRMLPILASEPVVERTTDVKTLDDGRFQTHMTFGDGEVVADVKTWTITTDRGEIVRIEEFWDRLSSFSTDRPESPAGGTLFDVMTAQTINRETAVCTWQTLLLTMTEAEFLAAGNAAIEESVVTAALDCELDPEAIPGLRLALQRSTLMTE
jgi:ketosteroid isomerase-like protein